MPDLAFAVDGAAAVPYCATPTLGVDLRVTNRTEERVHAVALDCQVRIDARRRRYADGEREGLGDIFGEPSRWSQTLRSLLWTHAHASVPPFAGGVSIQLHVPCSGDFNELATRYFQALGDGVVPVSLLFSGTVFYAGETGGLAVTRIPWDAEATFDLPVATWRDVVDRYYPSSGWLTLRLDTLDRLRGYRDRRALATWDQALEALLEAGDPSPLAGEEVRPRTGGGVARTEGPS
jgi:hypothetical protein